MNVMGANEERVRNFIAQEAAEWFVANREGLSAKERDAFAAWLNASPVHVEEYLAFSVIARDLREAGKESPGSIDEIIARARLEKDALMEPLWPRMITAVGAVAARRWRTAAVALAACVVVSFGLLAAWNLRPSAQDSAAPGVAAALHFETGRGEQLTRRLSDDSVLHLNTDSAVTIRFNKTERLVVVEAGEVDFEVAHEPDRAFRVVAKSAEVIAIGTQFDVYLRDDATLVTVVEGRVAVGPSPMLQGRSIRSDPNHSTRFVQLVAGQQISVTEGAWPVLPVAVDAQRSTAWLHRQITFDRQPLERVASEFNRYASKPIEIATPELRNMEISGVFTTDDTEAFIAFLRSLKGVRVEVTATQIRVSRD
jgi:transmembrane sensor